MAKMNVPCIMIDNDNFQRWWPTIIDCLINSHCLAIDLELSGLGTKDIYSSQIDERFKAIRKAAMTRSILSLGIACFHIDQTKGFFKNLKQKQRNKHQQKIELEHDLIMQQIADCLDPNDELSNDSNANNDGDDDTADNEDVIDDNYHIKASVFHFLTLNQQEFIMETRSMKFLVKQGFDFNELSLKGIPYTPGDDLVIGADDQQSKITHESIIHTEYPSIRKLFEFILSLRLPLLLHNGIIDISFLYHNFYAELPSKLDTFIADLYEMFPNGIYDTKLISNTYLSCSYLEYSFQYVQRMNYFRQLKQLSYLILDFDHFCDDDHRNDIRKYDLSANILQPNTDSSKICDAYSRYGWCEQSDQCKQSHNIDLILDDELLLSTKGNRNSKRSLLRLLERQKQKELKTDNITNDDDDVLGQNEPKSMMIQEQQQTPPPVAALVLHQKFGLHHAGNDAFMTGYYFLYNLFINNKPNANHHQSFSGGGNPQSNCESTLLAKYYHQELKRFRNKIFLSSKPQPLIIMKSSYAKCSPKHCKKYESIKCKYIKPLTFEK